MQPQEQNSQYSVSCRLFFYAETQKYCEELRNQALFDHATYDELTHCKNRYMLNTTIENNITEWKNNKEESLVVMMFDIDFFKKVNDTYGHQYGDYVLKTVADLMKSSFRKTDLLYRYGGEELVMIMPETNVEGAIIPVQRLRRSVEDYNFDYNGVKAKVTVSIGLTMNYGEFKSATELLKSADESLYRTKIIICIFCSETASTP